MITILTLLLQSAALPVDYEARLDAIENRQITAEDKLMRQTALLMHYRLSCSKKAAMRIATQKETAEILATAAEISCRETDPILRRVIEKRIVSTGKIGGNIAMTIASQQIAEMRRRSKDEALLTIIEARAQQP